VVASTGEEDRGVRQARFYVLRHNRRVAALVELGFLTNSKEGARVARSSAYCQKLANAVAGGVLSVVR
jgi:N-acetylmuramoyl-L-alanine amidase